MPLLTSTYRAPRWLPGGHLQTVWAARLVPLPEVAYRRERWTTPDGDFIDVDFAQPEPADPAARVLVLFHGLEGDSRSHYARSTMHHFAERGWRAAVVHFRGCSGEPNRLLRAYHSGDSDEGDWVLRAVHRRWPAARLHAVGISLGGNMLAKWLGERGEDAAFVTAAASVGSPLDLVAGGHAIGRGFNMLYTRMFLATLKAKARHKAERFGYAVDAAALRSARDLYDFDNLYTAPVHGFRDTLDYWTRASAKPLLANVRVPHLVLNARNDPFVPASSLPTVAEVSSEVVLEQPDEGGHIGFASGRFPGELRFLPERLDEFFRG
ncbi:MAG: alpha/beta fold hydrolase [Burkholderiaceae bacterium]|jgi:predicted alpha/beta-fold hydrolase|nr:alpha/beta fold hydrolase [Burkholderiaceae bacterium]